MKSGTVRAACTRGKLKKYIGSEVKQSGNTWLVTKSVMNKEYGEENKMKVGKEWKEVYGASEESNGGRFEIEIKEGV